MRPWFEGKPEQVARSGDSEEELELRKLRGQCKDIEFDLAVKQGLYTENSLVSEWLTGLGSDQKSFLQLKLEQELPRRLAMKDEETIRVVMRHVLDEVCGKMQTLVEKWTSGHGVSGSAESAKV